jgi:hypothetical protein
VQQFAAGTAHGSSELRQIPLWKTAFCMNVLQWLHTNNDRLLMVPRKYITELLAKAHVMTVSGADIRSSNARSKE